MKSKTRRICLVNSVYTLFLYYLICGFDEKDILSDKVPNIISVCKPKGEITEEAKKAEAGYAQSDDLNKY